MPLSLLSESLRLACERAERRVDVLGGAVDLRRVVSSLSLNDGVRSLEKSRRVVIVVFGMNLRLLIRH